MLVSDGSLHGVGPALTLHFPGVLAPKTARDHPFSVGKPHPQLSFVRNARLRLWCALGDSETDLKLALACANQ